MVSQNANHNIVGYLSARQTVDIHSSLNCRLAACSNSLDTHFRQIGAGTCGRIFHSADLQNANTVLKIEKDHHYGDRNLSNDYHFHLKTYREFDNQKSKIWRLYDAHIPIPLQFKPNSYNSLLPKSGTEFGSRDTLTMEYIPPVPARLRHALLQDFQGSEAGPHDQITNHDCLIRPYLGKERDQRTLPRRAFSLRNHSLCINDFQQLGLFDEYEDPGSPSTPMILSEAMGAALAMLHFGVNCDACDVEFVLGGRPVVPKPRCPPEKATYTYNSADREVHLWLLDFNQVRSVDWSIGGGEKGIEQAVSAFFRNDPYFPRPGRGPPELWYCFVESYRQTARDIIEGQFECRNTTKMFMPVMFIDSVEKEQKRRTEAAAAAEARTPGELKEEEKIN